MITLILQLRAAYKGIRSYLILSYKGISKHPAFTLCTLLVPLLLVTSVTVLLHSLQLARTLHRDARHCAVGESAVPLVAQLLAHAPHGGGRALLTLLERPVRLQLEAEFGLDGTDLLLVELIRTERLLGLLGIGGAPLPLRLVRRARGPRGRALVLAITPFGVRRVGGRAAKRHVYERRQREHLTREFGEISYFMTVKTPCKAGGGGKLREPLRHFLGICALGRPVAPPTGSEAPHSPPVKIL